MTEDTLDERGPPKKKCVGGWRRGGGRGKRSGIKGERDS